VEAPHRGLQVSVAPAGAGRCLIQAASDGALSHEVRLVLAHGSIWAFPPRGETPITAAEAIRLASLSRAELQNQAIRLKTTSRAFRR